MGAVAEAEAVLMPTGVSASDCGEWPRLRLRAGDSVATRGSGRSRFGSATASLSSSSVCLNNESFSIPAAPCPWRLMLPRFGGGASLSRVEGKAASLMLLWLGCW